MRVSRLQLQGFKSFSGRADLELGPGITAIVGPNGSGKSNLVDAIRLVLGETSARELRGQRLDQVIFAGGAKRAPVGMAEVTLVLDNEDGRLPVEDVEVAISRRVFRDGTSEFRRNGRRVRLRDLGRLLDATGLAQAGYAVIAQNDIESIIRATPAQRRHLIEEAAGVRGAQALIEDSGARLRSLSEWLEGSMGRLAELLPRIESLRAEAAAAGEAARLRSRLRELRGSLERGAWLAALSELRRLERQLEGGERRLDQLKERAQQFQTTYLVERDRWQAIQAGRLESERQSGVLALALQQAEAQVERWQDRAVQAAESRAVAADTLAEARDDLAAIAEPGPGLQVDRDSLEQGRALVGEVERELADLRRERSQRQAELAEFQLQEQETLRSLTAARRRQSELEAKLAGAEAWCVQAQAATGSAADVKEKAEAELKQVVEATKALRQAAARDTSARERAEKAESAQRQLVLRAEAGLSQATVGLREAEARLGAQSAVMVAGGDGAAIATAARSGKARLRRLSETIQAAQAEDAPAVEAGLGTLLSALVGEEAAARKALDLAGETAELVCWPVTDDHAIANTPEGCRPLATALVGEPSALSVVARLSRLICLARDRQAASRWLARFPDGRAVLADGTVLGTGLEITPARSEGGLRAAERLLEAERTVKRQRAELVQSEERLERAREAAAEQRELVDRARRQSAGTEAAAQARQADVDRMIAEAARAEGTITDLQHELRAREGQSSRDAQALATVSVELQSLERSLAAAAARVEACGAALASSEELILAAGRRLEEARLAIASSEAEARGEARRAEELRHRQDQLRVREHAAQERIHVAEQAASVALEQLEAARLQAAEARARLDRSAAQRAQALDSDQDPILALAELERNRAELEAAVTSAAGQVEVLRRDLVGQSQQVARLQAEAGQGPELLGEGETAAAIQDPAKAAAEIARTERRLNSLGPVNELAPGQLAEILERTQGLRAAHDDCLGAKEDLETVLAQLQSVSGGRFQTALTHVTREFESVWVELFGGGRATLAATPAGEDGSPGGVEMEVQPPGRRVIAMPLLSGGERALTALALVLAMQKVSPSPFYVFDEVDAALDDANITHFAELLRKRSESSQFLVVTHSLTTMSRASMLYGVTQDGDGSSRILSVRLTSDGRAVEAQDGAEMESVAAGG
jgi:chromosome segregation protein